MGMNMISGDVLKFASGRGTNANAISATPMCDIKFSGGLGGTESRDVGAQAIGGGIDKGERSI